MIMIIMLIASYVLTKYLCFLSLQVVTIILDPYYKNQTEVFKCEEHGSVKIMKIPTNLFGLPSKHKEDVRSFVNNYQLYNSGAAEPT